MKENDFTDDDILNIIMNELYAKAIVLNLCKDIYPKYKINLSINDSIRIKRKIEISGLAERPIHEQLTDDYRITPKGYEAIQNFGNYKRYIKYQKKKTSIDIFLLPYKKIVGILNFTHLLFSLISFIIGILLSDPIKDLLSKILIFARSVG